VYLEYGEWDEVEIGELGMGMGIGGAFADDEGWRGWEWCGEEGFVEEGWVDVHFAILRRDGRTVYGIAVGLQHLIVWYKYIIWMIMMCPLMFE
jgi:hypothetical protein